uniref:Uncharacterized protein n=1 Tax=viral metagenome TaxID=1070528 RepID=A0A6C0DBR8_9ZZZZ
MEVLAEFLLTEAARNVADKTIFNDVFVNDLLKLLPDAHYDEKYKIKFYENLKKEKYIIQEDFTILSNSGDKFNYKEKTEKDLENYLKKKINKDPNTDEDTIENIIKYYNRTKGILYWGGKNKHKKTKSKRISKRINKDTKPKSKHFIDKTKKTLSKQI